ncbi:MAG: hypothetical protein GC131_02060 [Alphaproteobacteria bacterium]|nr:hypothetical protein [Alphaproteobacteria bacterium]
MVRIAAIFFMLSLLLAAGALTEAHAASTADVRYVAIENNCTPKKIEVFNQKVGDNAEVTYRVECNLPKARDETSKTASAIHIRCRYDLCAFVKPEVSEGKN